MSPTANERRQAWLEIYRVLDEAEADFQNGDRGVSVEFIRQRACGSDVCQ